MSNIRINVKCTGIQEKEIVKESEKVKEIYNNLINPGVQKKSEQNSEKTEDVETGYKSSERTALENQLLQIETAAKAEEERAKAEE